MIIPITISIIIPAWNTATYLPSCLDSILKQSCPPVEIIIINDHSTDETSQILQSYQTYDKRIRVFHGQQNEGPGKCRNIGIERAQGEYIMFVDSDDFLTEGILDFLTKKYVERADKGEKE